MPAPAPVVAAIRGWFESLIAGDARGLARVALPHPELAELARHRPTAEVAARLRAELASPQIRVLELGNERALAQVYVGGTVQLLPLQGHGHDVKIDARYLLAARHEDDAPRAVARAFYRALLFHDLATLTELAFDARGVEVLAEGSAPPPGEHGQLELVVDVLALAELAVGEPFPTPSGLQFVTPRHQEMGIRVYRGLVPDGELPFLLRQREGAWKVIPFHFVQAVVVARGGTLRPATGNGGTATQTP